MKNVKRLEPVWTADGVKIGRRSDVQMTVTGEDPDTIAYRLWKIIRDRRLLISHDYEVSVVMGPRNESCNVEVTAGGRPVGTFTMKAT